MTSKVAVLDVLTDEFIARWREDLDGLPIELALVKDSSDDALTAAVSGARAVISRARPIDRTVLDKAGDSLRMAIKLSHWLAGVDGEECAKRSVRVETVPQLGCITVAEHAMTLILMSARDMVRSHNGVAAGRYRDHGLSPQATSERSFAFKWLPVHPFELYGKTLGIVGFGEIGKELAARANAFGMCVRYSDPHPAPAEIEQQLHAEHRELPSLLSEADFVSLHIPHTPKTEKLIGERELQQMKESAFLINACRGGVVDQDALVEALQTGRIAGAGLDVFVEEPLAYNNPLTKLDNVVLSPHIGGGSGAGRADQRDRVRTLLDELTVRAEGR